MEQAVTNFAATYGDCNRLEPQSSAAMANGMHDA
jgi:hypothetical protein